MSQRFESDFIGSKDTHLFYQGWEVANARGIVLINHGQAEHSDCYDRFAQALNKQNWNVYGYDMRGHGQSDGQRGYVAHFDDYETDLHLFIEHIKKHHSIEGPTVLFGHSLGGLVSIKYIIAHGSKQLSALTLSSPALGLSVHVPAFKDRLAELVADFAPRITMSNEIEFENLTHRSDILDSYKKDTLRHDRISPKVYLGMKHGFEQALKFADHIDLPILMQIATDDQIVSSDAAKNFFDKLANTNNKKLIEYTKSHHEIINDVEEELVIEDYLQFVNSFTKESS